MTEQSKMLTPREAAREAGVSTLTIYRRIHDGTIPAYRVGETPNAPIRIRADEFRAWLYGSDQAAGCRA